MAIIKENVWALGRSRIISYEDSLASAVALQQALALVPQLVYRPVGVAPYVAGWDTSETLTAAMVSALWNLRAYGFGVRYVPLAGQSAAAGIQPGELASIVGAGFGLMLVQFARTGTFSQQTWRNDGAAAAAAALRLGLAAGASSVSVWMDCAIYSSSADAINGCNAWFSGAVAGGLNGAQLGVYYEPGVPLTAQQRYQSVAFTRYWATAANDPARFVATRGCQLYQLWPGDRVVAPGVVVDNDAAQEDFGGIGSGGVGLYPIAAFAA